MSELTAFAERGDNDVVGVFKETASGASANRIARNRVLDLAHARHIDANLVSERVKSGFAAARARGKKLGRQPGHRPKSDKLAPNVLQAISEWSSSRCITRDLGISKSTVTEIVNRHRENA